MTLTPRDLALLLELLDEHDDDPARAVALWVAAVAPDSDTIDQLIDWTDAVPGPVGAALEAIDGPVIDRLIQWLRGLLDPSPEQIARRIQRRADRIDGWRPRVADAVRDLTRRLSGDRDALLALGVVARAAKRYTRKEAKNAR